MKPAPRASNGPSARWWTSPATLAGAAWSKAPAKILTSVPRWPARRSAAFRVRNSADPATCSPASKHYAGYGAADGGRDYDSSYIPEELMWNVYLPPFKAAADAGAATFMSAYMDLNDVPATGNRWLMHDVLRDAWHFKGFVVSDANAVHSLITHGYARDGKTPRSRPSTPASTWTWPAAPTSRSSPAK